MLVARIEHLPVMHLERYAGDDTWRGPRPSLCRATLATNQHQLYAAADDLRGQAYQLERHAEEIEAIARLQVDVAR